MRAALAWPGILLVLLFCVVALPAWGDTVYLKNGSVIMGEIVEHTPDVSYKLRTSDGSVFVFEMAEVLKVEFGPAVAPVRPSVDLMDIPGRKSPWGAVVGAWFVPTLGHAYAGNWGRGAPFLVGEVVAVTLIVNGANDTYWTWGGEELTDAGATKVLAGAGLLIVTRVWEYIDAYHTAEDYNRRLEKRYLERRLGLSLRADDKTPRFAFTYAF